MRKNGKIFFRYRCAPFENATKIQFFFGKVSNFFEEIHIISQI